MESSGETNRPWALSDEHMAELNGFLTVPTEERQARYVALREVYADNPQALEEIDIFDKSSPYGQALKEYSEALKEGNTTRQAELEDWFRTNYPNTDRG